MVVRALLSVLFFLNSSSGFIQLNPGIIYRGIHKELDFRDDRTEFFCLSLTLLILCNSINL